MQHKETRCLCLWISIVYLLGVLGMARSTRFTSIPTSCISCPPCGSEFLLRCGLSDRLHRGKNFHEEDMRYRRGNYRSNASNP